MYQTNGYIQNDNSSFEYITPNSRIIPQRNDYNNNNKVNNMDWKRPERSSSLQKQEFTRESLVDPNSRSFMYRETFIEPDISTMKMDRNLMIDINNQANKIKSNIQYVTTSPIQVQHGYVDLPQPSVAQIENYSPIMRPSLSSKSPKPALPPLVIPITPSRSAITRSRPYELNTTPQTPILNTPGSSHSLNSASGSGVGHTAFNFSPSTPSPHTQLLHVKLSRSNTYHSRISVLPESEPERLVLQGIELHELGKLEQATELFKKAAFMDLPVGMFLYGISLRHGWGCTRNEYLAFQYLQKAAEYAVQELSKLSGANIAAAKNELIMSIYEMGISYRHGWGCKKNKETAFHYFKIAADLNDPDAQNDLAYCFHHGIGTKKDLYNAAKYYRKAEKQGHGIMGNSWIWKSKYDNPK